MQTSNCTSLSLHTLTHALALRGVGEGQSATPMLHIVRAPGAAPLAPPVDLRVLNILNIVVCVL